MLPVGVKTDVEERSFDFSVEQEKRMWSGLRSEFRINLIEPATHTHPLVL
jgi:hypothetical protein